MKENNHIHLFLQGDARWSQLPYGNTVMEMCGCGPTSLSMVVCGLTGSTAWSPAAVARYSMEHGYYKTGFGTAFELMTAGAQDMGIQAEPGVVRADYILENLRMGTPMISLMGPGDFIEGENTHFIVLTGVDGEGKVKINDPLSEENSQKVWDAGQLAQQMLELWKYSKKTGA